MIHGGDIYTDGILKNRELLDFSSNINPFGAPKLFVDNINEALKNVEKYPDIKYRELLANLKNYTGIEEQYFVLGNGAAEIIDLAASCFDSVLIVVPSFAEYETSAKKWGCRIEYSYLTQDMDFDYEDIKYKLQKTEALIIGNPNNPNGRIIDKKKFEAILKFCEKNQKFIVIDEAFIEFTGDASNSFINEVSNLNCIVIIRALTKFFGMPGIRFGYGISTSDYILGEIRKRQNPWNINCFAELAVKYALNDTSYIEKSLAWIRQERELFVSELKNISFINTVFPTNANFVLCKLNGVDGENLYGLCLDRGVLIRKAENFKGLDKRFVRLAIKDRCSNRRLIETFQKIEMI